MLKTNINLILLKTNKRSYSHSSIS